MAKKFIATAIKRPGRERKAAARAGMSTHAYMEKHQHDSGSGGAAARLGLRLEAMHHSQHKVAKEKTEKRGGNKTAAHKIYPHLD